MAGFDVELALGHRRDGRLVGDGAGHGRWTRARLIEAIAAGDHRMVID